jgi:predicted nucleic acid-binding protein
VDLVGSARLLGEGGEVLLRRYRLGELGDTQIDLAVLALPRPVIPMPLGDLVEPAFEIVMTASTDFHDALYVAAASWRAVPLVPADARMRASLSGSRWASRVIALEDWRMYEPPA